MIYLINRLAIVALNYQTSYMTLLGKEFDYSILRVFCCACYALLRPRNDHKLRFRSKKCIFLGYSSNHHSYWCSNPLFNIVYICRHVVFDENTFPASDKVFSASLPCARESTSVLGKSTFPSPFIFTPLISHVSCMPLQNQIALIKIPLLSPASITPQIEPSSPFT